MGCGSHIHKHTANEEHSKDVNYWETFQYGLYTIYQMALLYKY